MAIAPKYIRDVIEPAVTGLGYELVGVEYLSQGRHSTLRIYIDHEDGITLDDCGRVSHQVSGVLDVEDVIKGNYALEVSSPGLDRPLFTLEHFVRFQGREAKVRLRVAQEGRKKFTGLILGVEGEQVLLQVDGQTVALPIGIVEKANLVPDI